MTEKKLKSIIEHARKGQDFIARKLSLLERGESTILTPEYRAKQQADYAHYQAAIDRANAQLNAR